VSLTTDLQLPRLKTDYWNDYFRPGGTWEERSGREQTRLFARAFCRHTRLDRNNRLCFADSSCALGDAMPILHDHFPNARLFGFDFSPIAIDRCKQAFGNVASFAVADIENIDGLYDVIYSSATLEHFPDYREKARALLRHCRHLAIMVPFDEKRNGQDLQHDPDHDHVVTFREDSFDFLVQEQLATKILPPRIFAVPGAWSWSRQRWLVEASRNVGRLVLRRPLARNKKMILFEVVSSLFPGDTRD